MAIPGVRALMRAAALLAMVTWLGGCAMLPADAPPAGGGFVQRSVTVDGVARRYQVFVPSRGARQGASAAVIVFLHGTGERGEDGDRPTRVGLGPYLRAHAADFPAIVVFPQAPDGMDWKGTAADIAFAALEAATAEFGGDRDRTTLTGLSMGGYGTWELALLQPGRFAALVPVCGGLTAPREERDLTVTPLQGEVDPASALARRVKDVPVWIFHGARDDVVPPAQSRAIHAALQAAGAKDARYTEFPEANHNSWDDAYSRTPALWAWLLAQRRR